MVIKEKMKNKIKQKKQKTKSGAFNYLNSQFLDFGLKIDVGKTHETK